MKSNSLAALLHAFFHEWMGKQRNLSRHTVCSYRDTWKLLLRFTSKRKRREIARLSLADLQASEVIAFLEHLENDRKASIGTRNCRLSAIHSFFGFVAHREPLQRRGICVRSAISSMLTASKPRAMNICTARLIRLQVHDFQIRSLARLCRTAHCNDHFDYRADRKKSVARWSQSVGADIGSVRH
jgi:site-specific recombinase XerC